MIILPPVYLRGKLKDTILDWEDSLPDDEIDKAIEASKLVETLHIDTPIYMFISYYSPIQFIIVFIEMLIMPGSYF